MPSAHCDRYLFCDPLTCDTFERDARIVPARHAVASYDWTTLTLDKGFICGQSESLNHDVAARQGNSGYFWYIGAVDDFSKLCQSQASSWIHGWIYKIRDIGLTALDLRQCRSCNSQEA